MRPLRTAAVLGGGAVGAALFEELPKSGVRVVASWSRSGGLAPPPLDGAEVVLLAVPDAAIAPLCARLDVGRGQLVAHLAGALSLAPLAAARRKGARVGSIHPLRAFVRGRAQDFRGAFAGLTGSDASARGQLADLARRLGMTPLLIGDRSRALYHAAAVLAAGSQVALFAEAVRAFRKATGASEPEARAALLPLAIGALENLRAQPPENAITGPAARGDTATILAHRKALSKDFLPLYDALTRLSLRLAHKARAPVRARVRTRSRERGR
jgi:predicted short-subunit dehydrogenase-like oxidoreductase (DUF2520 family)